jgi:hypothetical protein
MGAKTLYEQFHGHAVRWIERFQFHDPKKLVILGKAHAIEYVSDKFNGGGDGKKAIYRHTFETPALVCADERGKCQLYILGDELIVTSDGIEN